MKSALGAAVTISIEVPPSAKRSKRARQVPSSNVKSVSPASACARRAA
ncbi:MAG: hypothetical protein O2979_07335 [Proteobacteria bacterium]|nr:hypothetical protein [Pseudomonadota bacterium]